MDGYTKLHEILGTALKQAGDESGMLLGQDLSISLADSLKTNKTSYFSDLDDACFVIGVDSLESYGGKFYLIFSLRDAIVMSGTLLGIPPARIQEKKRLSIIENDDFDAFSEIGNMINGSFNTVFQGSLPDKVRLKVLPPKKYIPEIDKITDEEPIPEGEYLMFRAKLEMGAHEMHYLDVMIPELLGNQYDPPVEVPPEPEVEEVQEEAQPEAADEAVAAVGPADSGVDSIVVLDDDEDARRLIVDAVKFTGFKVVEGLLNSDIKELFSGRRVRLVIICSVDADDRELSVCIKVNAMRQDSPPPIIMSAQRWTRTAALKALKYGARDIIIMPCSNEELESKVRKFCKMSE
jgi:CheY-like chemotaxis protein/chemotaxis protein CheY-P-specific phosphatase CheC